MAQYSVNWSARVATAAGTISAGYCVVDTGSGYVVATSANRTTYGKPDGLAVTAGDSSNPIAIIEFGPVANTYTSLGTGVAGPVRVSTTGVLERVATPSSSDEVVGYCETDGRAHVAFGVLSHRVYVDGGGGGTPGGSDKDIQYNNAGSFGGISPSTSGNLMTSNGTAWASTAPSFAASVIASGTLVHERGGLEADVSAYSGLVKITGGATSAVTAPTGDVVGHTDSQTLTNKTIVAASNTITDTSAASGDLLVHNGTRFVRLAMGAADTVLTVNSLGSAVSWAAPAVAVGAISGLGTGVGTWLATPSSANLRGAITDETGSGALVFGTSPTISGATLTGTVNVADPGTESGSIAYVGATYPADFKVNAFGASTVATAIFHRHSTADGCNIVFSRTNADDSSHATSANGDVLSSLIFAGHDGTDYNPAAQITVRVDGTVGANDMPGAIDFYTTPDGTNTPARALIIDNAQVLTLSKAPKIADSTGGQFYTFAVSNLAADRTVTLPLLGASDTFVFEAHAQTLTNKTLTAPVISTISNTGTLTLPTSTDTLVGRATTDTLTNKTLTSPTLGGTPVVSGTALNATGNARCKVYSQVANVQTTDATVTSVDTWTITDECTTLVTVEVLACQSTGANTAAYVRRVRIKRDGGTVTVGTVEESYTSEEVAGWDVTVDNSTSTGRVRVTGAAATTIDWGCVMTRIEVTHA